MSISDGTLPPFPEQGDFYSEEETDVVFDLLKNRHKDDDRTATQYFEKALRTVEMIMGSFGMSQQFSRLEEMYKVRDYSNTLKLILRCKMLFSC